MMLAMRDNAEGDAQEIMKEVQDLSKEIEQLQETKAQMDDKR